MTRPGDQQSRARHTARHWRRYDADLAYHNCPPDCTLGMASQPPVSNMLGDSMPGIVATADREAGWQEACGRPRKRQRSGRERKCGVEPDREDAGERSGAAAGLRHQHDGTGEGHLARAARRSRGGGSGWPGQRGHPIAGRVSGNHLDVSGSPAMTETPVRARVETVRTPAMEAPCRAA